MNRNQQHNESNLGQKEAEQEKAQKQQQQDMEQQRKGREQGKYNVMKKHRQVRP